MSKSPCMRARHACQASKVSAFSRSPICCETRHSAVPSACSRVRGERRLLFGPAGEDGGKGRPVVRRVRGAGCVADCGARIISSVGRRYRWQLDGPRGVAAGAAYHLDRSVHRAHHGVVKASEDGTVVAEERVGKTALDQMVPCESASSVSMGSSLTLPLVMTSERTPRSRAGGEQKVLERLCRGA